TLLSIVLFLVLIGILSYRKYSLVVSSILLIAYTFVMGLANIWSYWLLLPVALILLPFTLPSIRKAYISAPALKAFQKVMPSMSKTEQEAIDAGTTWWEGELFR
ncbi:acyl-CoA dehydrogenase, partial [Klebsiella oxytoca]